jgi:hypothetical protein
LVPRRWHATAAVAPNGLDLRRSVCVLETQTGDTGPMAKRVLPDLVRPPVWDIEDGHDYLTLRIWDVALPPLVVVGMNPGKPQTTSSYVGQYIERGTLIAVRFGFGGLTLVQPLDDRGERLDPGPCGSREGRAQGRCRAA